MFKIGFQIIMLLFLLPSASEANVIQDTLFENKRTGVQLRFRCLDESCIKIEISFNGNTYRIVSTENLIERIELAQMQLEYENHDQHFKLTRSFYETVGHMGWTGLTFIPPIIAIPSALIAMDVLLTPKKLVYNIMLKKNLARSLKQIQLAIVTGKVVRLNDRQFDRILNLIQKLN